MCGINGVYFFGETEPGAVEEMLQRMLRATAHRGPDAAATLITAKHGIGVNRLSVIGDPTAAGIYTHGDFLSATFNGVIVNHPDLRRRLSLVPAANPPDGEVILPLFQQRDTDFVRDLHGMFAVCIYDKVRHRLVLARDRLGVKPLYYCVTGGAVYVSSEIKGIAAGMDEKLSPDRSALGHVLRFRFHPGETTVFSKVKRVRPGEIVVFDGPRPKRRYYWSIPGVSDPPREDEKTLSEEVGELVNRVTGDHLLSDVEGGFLASGGLDSSLLVMLASARQSSYRTPFSLRFRPVRTPDEHYAISLSGHLSQPVTWVSVTPRSARDCLIELVRYLDEPLENPAHVGTYLMAKRAAESGVKTVITGDGADEFFLGYERYAHWLAPDRENRAGKYRKAVETLTEKDAHRLYTGDFREALMPLHDYDGKAVQLDSFGNCLRFEQFDRLPEYHCMRLDRMTMAHGVEARPPFLDHRLVECAQSVPPGLRFGSSGKRLLKLAAAGNVPRSILERSKKQFPGSREVWLAGPGREWAREILLDGNARTRHMLNGGALEKLLNRETISKSLARKLWACITLELWLQQDWVADAR